MKLNIKATGIELTPSISDYVSNKILTVEKYLDKDNPDAVAQVEVGKNSKHHKAGNVFMAEVHITGNGLDVYAVSEQEDLYAAIDLVRDEIIHNALQSKGRRLTLARRSAEAMKRMIKGLRNFRNRH